MTSTLPTQEQVNQLAQSLAPDVVRIRMREASDWAGDAALYFYVILADSAKRRLNEVVDQVEERLRDDLGLLDLTLAYHVHYRNASEQQRFQEQLWD